MLEFTGLAWYMIQLFSILSIALGLAIGVGWIFFALKLTDTFARFAKILYGAGFLMFTAAELLRTIEDFTATPDIIEYSENIVLIAGFFMFSWAAQQHMMISRVYGFSGMPARQGTEGKNRQSKNKRQRKGFK